MTTPLQYFFAVRGQIIRIDVPEFRIGDHSFYLSDDIRLVTVQQFGEGFDVECMLCCALLCDSCAAFRVKVVKRFATNHSKGFFNIGQ